MTFLNRFSKFRTLPPLFYAYFLYIGIAHLTMKKTVYFIFFILILACSKREDRFPQNDPSGDSQNIATPNDNSDDNSDDSNDATDDNNEPSNLNDLTTDFQSLITQNGFEGAQIAITRNSKLIYLESFGKANLEENILVDENSLFRISSVSKPITLLAISTLVAENKLQLEDLVFGPNSILGEVYGTPPYEANEVMITVSHLIEHRAGFTDNPFDIMFDDIALSQSELIGKVLDERSLTYQPGETYEFSNFGYVLLGRIIEKVSGKTYETFVKDNILSPMGISKMYIANNTTAEAFDNEVRYYSNWIPPYDLNVNRMDSHGGWVASAQSLALLAIFSDGNATVPDIIPSNEAVSYLTHGSWSHDGALPGTTAVMSVGNPTSYIVLLNTGDANFTATIRIISEFMDAKIEGRTAWPTENLFDNR